MYNLIEYSDNSSHTSESSWSFKRDDIVNNVDVVTNDDNAPSFKYKASNIGNIMEWNTKWSKNSCTTQIFK